KDSLLLTKPVVQVMKNGPNIFWITSWGNGLIRYNATENTLTQFLPEKNNPNSIVNEIAINVLKDVHGNIWASSMGGISRFLKESDGFRNYLFAGTGGGFLFVDSRGTLWA